MEVHRQRCQACQSLQLHNIIVRAPGRDTTIFVRCARCQALVARYELSSYYHHGKGPQEHLRATGIPFEESGRGYLDAFLDLQRDVEAGYQDALDALAADNKGFF
jgi:uncharacterized C2H2 Zn-finger protein